MICVSQSAHDNYFIHRGFSDISIKVFAAFEHNLTSISEPAAQSMIKTFKQHDIDYTVWPIQGGGGPWTVVPNMFDVPCVRGGGIGGGAGKPIDEFVVIEGDGKIAGLAEAEKYFVDLLYNFAETMQA